MFSGTLIAMIFKYVLDKKYIFSYVPENKKEDGIKFIKYMFMGILTTLIYWCFEWSFDYYFKSDYSKYFGAFIGLSIGYFIKYLLDKKFVFK
jgi:putative flippase GtrA